MTSLTSAINAAAKIYEIDLRTTALPYPMTRKNRASMSVNGNGGLRLMFQQYSPVSGWPG
jgi:hypothetical protein